MKRFEEGNVTVEDAPVIKTVDDTDDYEEYVMTVYQKKATPEWERVEIKYKRKKKL